MKSTKPLINFQNQEEKFRLVSLYLFCSAVIILLYLFSTFNNNKITPDSEWYLAIAKNIANARKYLGPGNAEVLYWPPLYPLILSLFSKQLYSFIKVLHLVAFLGSFTFWISIAKEHFSYKFLSFFSLLFCLSTPLLMIHTFVWSEALFLFFLSGYLYFILRFNKEQNKYFLFVASFLGLLMIMQRNAGFFITVPATVVLILFTRNPYYLILFFISVSGGIYWNFKKIIMEGNQQVFSELIPEISLLRNFENVSKELTLLFLPNIYSLELGLALSFIFMWVLVSIWKKGPLFIKLASSILVFYIIVWIVIPANSDDISRFLAVVLPLLYFILTYNLQLVNGQLPRFTAKILAGMFVIMFIYQGIRISYNSYRWSELKLESLQFLMK